MNSSIFIDSSLLIEYRKENQTDFLEVLVNEPLIRLCISQTVVSEYLYYHLAIFGKKSPLAIKMSKGIPEILLQKNPLLLLNFSPGCPTTLPCSRLP